MSSTFSIAHIPALAPHVNEILSSSAPLSEIAPDVYGLVPSELGFSLLLSTVLPVLIDRRRPSSCRVAALFTLARAHESAESDPFRTSYVEVLQAETSRLDLSWETDSDDDDVPSETATTSLGWATLYVLAGLRDRLASFTAADLALSTFPLPVGDTFGLSAALQTARASSSRSGETFPTRDSLAQLVRLIYTARTRALSSREERIVPPLAATYLGLLPALFPSTCLHCTARHNLDLVKAFIIQLLSNPTATVALDTYLYALATLPPTLPSLELLSKLLREPGAVADIIKAEALGRFCTGAVTRLDELELRRKAGDSQVDEAVSRGVEVLSRFLLSLLQSKVLHPSDALVVEATSFTLRFSRFPQAQALYRALIGTGDDMQAGHS